MPLVFAAAMGGNLSLIGAPGNMIAQSALSEIGLGFGFFEYAIVGLPILICGTLFYTTLGMQASYRTGSQKMTGRLIPQLITAMYRPGSRSFHW